MFLIHSLWTEKYTTYNRENLFFMELKQSFLIRGTGKTVEKLSSFVFRKKINTVKGIPTGVTFLSQ